MDLLRRNIWTTMNGSNSVQELFDDFGRGAGLEKRSGSWYHRSSDVIAVSNLQKSQYAHKYYWNQGFWLLPLGESKFPAENKCHIRIRLGSLFPDVAETLDALLDLDQAVNDRTTRLHQILEQRLLPVIKRGATIGGLKSLLDEGAFNAGGVSAAAQGFLSQF